MKEMTREELLEEIKILQQNYLGSEVDRKYFEHELVPQLLKEIEELKEQLKKYNEFRQETNY
jgi:predicted RNase H-like HicB family nuclease